MIIRTITIKNGWIKLYVNDDSYFLTIHTDCCMRNGEFHPSQEVTIAERKNLMTLIDFIIKTINEEEKLRVYKVPY